MTKVIKILNMQLRNFKGVRDLTISFDDVTNINGDNATGKTTIFDGFTWLLFGKNSGDAKDFNIKTLDDHNNPIHKLEHEVAATLNIDGKDMKLRRVFKEKWVKKRGSETSEFTGHETEFFIDDVPLSQNEYKIRIDFYLKEELAKLITSPLYFNQMDWKNRRAVLESMVGNITNEEIAGNNIDFKNLLELLDSASLIDFKKKIVAKKKLIKDNLETIPTRIDEAKRSRPEAQDYPTIEQLISKKQAEVAELDAELEKKPEGYERQLSLMRRDQLTLNNLKIELGKLESQNKSAKTNAIAEMDGKISTLEINIRNDKQLISSNESGIEKNKTRIEILDIENKKLREQWNTENARELLIDEHKFTCPTCMQRLPEDQRENMRETLINNFHKSKTAKLKEINDQGQYNKARIADLQEGIMELQNLTIEINTRLGNFESQFQYLKELRQSTFDKPEVESKEITELKKAIEGFIIPEAPVIDNTELKNKKTVLNSEIDSLKSSLASRDQITKLNARIQELEADEKKLSQELANLERIEFTIDAFNKAKIETIESRINSKFKIVRFKMFEQQINGGEIECCECMVNGVPYSDVNTAGKINAGIDVINALTDHYGINAPVWIDNRESIIRILNCKSQIINLRAVMGKPLTVSTEELEEQFQ